MGPEPGAGQPEGGGGAGAGRGDDAGPAAPEGLHPGLAVRGESARGERLQLLSKLGGIVTAALQFWLYKIVRTCVFGDCF